MDDVVDEVFQESFPNTVEDEARSIETTSVFSSSASSPAPPEPFEALFKIRFTDDVMKDGDVVKYTLKATRTDGRLEEFTINRQYEDLEWLEHCLTTCRNISGLIIPPLPEKPAITPPMAEAKSRKQLGNSSKTIIGDEFFKDCRILEKYLNSLLAHSIFGQDVQLETFLTKCEPPARAMVKKGFFSRLSDKMENRKASHKDCEEFFQKERDWATTYGDYLKEMSENFNKIVYAQQRLCNSLAHLSAALNLGIGTNEGYNGVINKLMARYSESLNEFKNGLEEHASDVDTTMGISLEFYSRYVEAEKDMLFRRTCLLVDYENANKALDKAKVNKRDIAEKAKLDAEKAFEECSDVARQEIKKFHRHRVPAMQEIIRHYAQVQLKASKNTYAILYQGLSTLKQFPIPRAPIIDGE